MKTRFTILLIFNTALLVLLVYALLYATEHHAHKLLLSGLVVVISLYIFLFIRNYSRHFSLPNSSEQNAGIKNNN